LLVAPKSGKETREQLKGLAEEVKGKAEALVDQVKGKAETYIEEMKDEVASVAGKGQRDGRKRERPSRRTEDPFLRRPWKPARKHTKKKKKSLQKSSLPQ
jgi:gas vesicle protein